MTTTQRDSNIRTINRGLQLLGFVKEFISVNLFFFIQSDFAAEKNFQHESKRSFD
jgi:hypothetical protein